MVRRLFVYFWQCKLNIKRLSSIKMENKHRYLIHYMLKHGAVPVERVLEYCRHASVGDVHDLTQLKLVIITINREISRNFFKIVLATCEVTNKELLIWLNTKNDDISKLQITFNALELEYFHAILTELLNSESSRLTYIVVLNITSTLRTNFSRDNGQNVLKKWLKGGYFIQKGDHIYLGSRLILEFTSHLKKHYPDKICKLCSELVFTGRTCGICDRLLHSYCLAKYLTSQNNKCPSCKKHWVEKDDNVLEIQQLNNIQEYMDTDDEETQENYDHAGPSNQ